MQKTSNKPKDPIKIILLGDSSVGKSKLIERFLLDNYYKQQQSTYALTLFKYKTKIEGEDIEIDFWDTAGQARFNDVHPSYFYKTNACILVFDTTRKITYDNLEKWYNELQNFQKGTPCIVVGNKIDIDESVTQKQFKFASNRNLPFYFASAAEGTNVVKIFMEAVKLGREFRDKPKNDVTTELFSLLGED